MERNARPVVVNRPINRDLAWIRDGFDQVLADCQSFSGSVWPLIRSLAGGAVRERASAG